MGESEVAGERSATAGDLLRNDRIRINDLAVYIVSSEAGYL